MLKEMSKKWITVMLFLVAITNFCHAQKFCHHMKMNQEYYTQNTIDSRTDTFDVLHYTIDASFLNYKTNKKIEAQIIILE